MPTTIESSRKSAIGGAAALAGLAVLTVAMVPARNHLSVAIPALTYVVPVIVGVVLGGLLPGVLAAVAGFLLYDFFFLPPYDTFTVRSPQNWLALLVYLVVALVVTRVVTNLKEAREEARGREEDTGRLFELSQTLIGDLSLTQLLEHIARSVQSAFAPRWTALLLPTGEGTDLQLAASAGAPLEPEDVRSVTAGHGEIRSLGLLGGGRPSRAAVALVASNRPVGLLVLHDVQFARQDRSLLGTFANQAALAIERAQLQEAVLRSRLLEEVDRWRGAMMGAVSHDLRTPLASMKAAVSSLRQPGGALEADDRSELLELIEVQADRLARLVTNLLDMTRIEAGALEVRRAVVSVDELVGEALAALANSLDGQRVRIAMDADLPPLYVDHVLAGQVLVNLLENAARVAPEDSRIVVSAHLVGDDLVAVAVTDEGPGIPPDERARVFEMFNQIGGGGRAGLGLAIAKSFVEAHGGTIWIDPDVERGTRVTFTLPAAADSAADEMVDIPAVAHGSGGTPT
ncbi:MAG TPA: ATP-binding protein [Acidimicrobiales bacterium]|jgi:two-component system sensor histidine kinase KdpD